MYKNRSFEIDFDALAEMLKDAVDKVKSQENPDTLNQIKKAYKKMFHSLLECMLLLILQKKHKNVTAAPVNFPKKILSSVILERMCRKFLPNTAI